MKKIFAIATALCAGLMISACDDSSSSASEGDSSSSSAGVENPSSSSGTDDCTLSEVGVRVLFPAGGETFKIGDTIDVKYVANYKNAGGFHIYFLADSSSNEKDLFEESVGETAPNGTHCETIRTVLSEDNVVASDKAFLRVSAYNALKVRGDSKTFTVQE